MSFVDTKNFTKPNELSTEAFKNSTENEICYDDEVSPARKFVKHFVTEGHKCPLSEKYDDPHSKKDLPTFYDESMFKKGQDFIHKNITGVLIGSYIAMFFGFTQQPFGKILKMTKKSSTPVTAYKRYAGTLMHMCTWYDSDFEPDSKMWSSIRIVRKMHKSASKQSQSRFNHNFTQYDMSITIIALMGFPLIRPEEVGIYNVDEDELKCFIHFWRVIGYLVGIEDEFNMCRDSLEETKEICTLLIQEDLIPKMRNDCSDFEGLSKAFVRGVQAIIPFLLYGQTIEYTHKIIASISDDEYLKQIAPVRSKSRLNFITCFVNIMKYDTGRVVMNNILNAMIWLMKVFPIFAYLKFGVKDARVRI